MFMEEIEQKLDNFIINNRIPHIIFHGTHCVDKKSIVTKFIQKRIYCRPIVHMVRELNLYEKTSSFLQRQILAQVIQIYSNLLFCTMQIV